MNSLPARIAEAIEASPHSRAALARKVGRHDLTLRRWARGESTPSADDLARLAHHAAVNYAWLAEGRGRRDTERPPELTGQIRLLFFGRHVYTFHYQLEAHPSDQAVELTEAPEIEIAGLLFENGTP